MSLVLMGCMQDSLKPGLSPQEQKDIWGVTEQALERNFHGHEGHSP